MSSSKMMPLRVLCSIFILLTAVFNLSHCAAASLPDFQRHNPDIAKYAFARSYIEALNYVNNINLRWKKASPKELYAGDDVKVMRGYVSYLIKDNMDLRIARNFLTKYLHSENLLVRKTADTFIAACLTHIAINDKEKQVWDQWYAVKSNHLDTPANEKAFLKTQRDLTLKRKETGKKMIEASVLLANVLKSGRNTDEKGHLLAVTSKQREYLLGRLDEFGKDSLEWGLKAGQDHMQASIAVIREVLEDTVYYASLDDAPNPTAGLRQK
ncbi:MAG: hypothetical protein HY591_02610 [Candidatus Omnitrophica bacterium]|nr:hypothetical protein [Candidatus Omnitrophota bacterium]